MYCVGKVTFILRVFTTNPPLLFKNLGSDTFKMLQYHTIINGDGRLYLMYINLFPSSITYNTLLIKLELKYTTLYETTRRKIKYKPIYS